MARSFSGDKEQLVPLLKAGLAHRGFALIDVISPCVTFNDHEGSTKSYLFTREHDVKVSVADFVPGGRRSWPPFPRTAAHCADARRQCGSLQFGPG